MRSHYIITGKDQTAMSKGHLLHLIETKREELIDVAKKYGFSAHATITCSQELDQLLNKYNTQEKNIKTNTFYPTKRRYRSRYSSN